jgi:hypothetical protein
MFALSRLVATRSPRLRRVARATGGVAVLVALVALVAPAAASPVTGAHLGVRTGRPGPVGAAFPILSGVSLTGQSGDMAMGANGTAYLGWISSSISNSNLRRVHLCVLPLGARACKGGVQTIEAGDPSTAADLFVLAPRGGKVTLVWYHDTSSSGTNSHAAQIAEATVTNGVLSPETDVAAGPSHGELLDAVVGPGGKIWTLAYAGATSLEVRAGVTSSPVQVKIPFETAYAHLAFAGTTPIIAITDGVDTTQPPSYSYRPGSTWKAFRKVPGGAWDVGIDFGLTSTSRGVRLITGDGKTNYYSSVVSRWTGHAFSPVRSIGDITDVTTHDVVTDRSGRLVNLSEEGSNYAVGNLADTLHAATFRFSTHGDPAGFAAQVATTPRGHGVAMWAVEKGTTGDTILVQPFRLAGLHRSVTKRGRHGSVRLVGPASCLPASSLSVSVKGHGKPGWKVHSRKLSLNGKKVGSSINGASLRAGRTYTLKGTVVFSHGSSHSTVRAALTFRTCPNP